jgi:iron complex transport system substrate-binding protein
MKKIILLLSISLVFVSCKNNKKESAPSDAVETVTITHSQGTIDVPLKPQRLVVLDFAALENLDKIGANVVGMPKLAVPSNLEKYAKDDNIVNVGSLVEVNMETINELQPDLIIIGGRLAESYSLLSKIAPTIITTFDTTDPIGALHKDLQNLGKIFDEEDTYEKLFNNLQQKITDAKQTIQDSNEKALVVLHNRGRFSAYGSGSRFGLIHDILGVQEAAEGLDSHLHGTRASSEFIKETNPDILFVVDRSEAIGEQALERTDVENELIQRTEAYKNGKIMYLNSEAWYLSGTGGITSINLMVDEIESVFQKENATLETAE